MKTLHWFNGFTTDKNTVKSRYRELVKQYHPDVNKDATGEEIKEINGEYEMVYDAIISGNPIFDILVKEDRVALTSYIPLFLIRNKKDFVPGQFVSYTFDRQKCVKVIPELYHTDGNANLDIKPGLHICEIIENEQEKISYSTPQALNQYKIRVVTDKQFEEITISDLLDVIKQLKLQYGFEYTDEYITKYNTQFGTFYGYGPRYETPFENVNIITKINGNICFGKVHLKHLGNYTTEKYSYLDIIAYYYADVSADSLFADIDFHMPEIGRYLGFDYRRDRVIDWPFDPTIMRYVKKGILTVYRHGYEYLAVFDENKLYNAFVNKMIDLEDFDICCDWIDEQYNKTLAKFKRDVKHDRIKLNI